jgi:hypothetical protein
MGRYRDRTGGDGNKKKKTEKRRQDYIKKYLADWECVGVWSDGIGASMKRTKGASGHKPRERHAEETQARHDGKEDHSTRLNGGK